MSASKFGCHAVLKYIWTLDTTWRGKYWSTNPSLSCVHKHLLSSDWKRLSCLSKYLDTVSVCLCVPVLWWSLQFLNIRELLLSLISKYECKFYVFKLRSTCFSYQESFEFSDSLSLNLHENLFTMCSEDRICLPNSETVLIRKVSDAILDHVWNQFKMAYQPVLQSRQSPSLNIGSSWCVVVFFVFLSQDSRYSAAIYKHESDRCRLFLPFLINLSRFKF